MTFYPITPVPKPRMTKRDRWKRRPCVLRYWAFKDECRERNATVENGDDITFYMPMPKSWSVNLKFSMDCTPHDKKPDIDNLLKALMDAVHKDDSHLHTFGEIRKVWSLTPGIGINQSKVAV